MYLESGRYPGLEARATGFMFGNSVTFTLPDGEEVYVDLIDGNLANGVAALQRIDDWYDENGTKAGLSVFQTVNDINARNYHFEEPEKVIAQMKSLGYTLAKAGAGTWKLIDDSTGEKVFVHEMMGRAGRNKEFLPPHLGKWLWNNISDEQVQQLIAENENLASEAIGKYTAKREEEYAKISDEDAVSTLENDGTVTKSIRNALEGKISLSLIHI